MAKRYRVELIQDELFALCQRVDGLERVIVVSLDGFEVSAYPPVADQEIEPPLHSPNIAATAANAIALGEKALKRLNQGALERLIVEGKEGTMIIYPIEKTDAALVVMVDKSAKMGLVSLVMRQSIGQLVPILDRKFSD